MKKTLSLTLSVLMLHFFSYAPLANDTPNEEAKKAMLAAEVRASVANLGVGKSSVVRVVLRDKTKYHGYITEITDEQFVVADAKTGATAPIAYPEVKGIKGNNFSTGAKIGIGVAIAAAVVAIIVAVATGDDDDENDGRCRLASVTTPCPPGCVCTQ